MYLALQEDWLNVRETRRGDKEWTLHRHRQHLAHDTKRTHTKEKHNTESKKDEQHHLDNIFLIFGPIFSYII